MFEVKNFINKLSKFQKISCIIFMFVFVSFLVLSIVIPTLANPNENININGYSWSEFIEESNIETIHLGYNTEFSIDSLDAEEKYYLISSEALELSELDQETWVEYNEPVKINKEGSYIIYAKLIDNGVASYINTDLLVLSYYNINLDDKTWNNLRNELDYLYINKEETLNVEVNDDIPGIKSVKYYISNELLNHNDLDDLSSNWSLYTNPILINEIGKYIIYVQIIDNNNRTTYINSDYIILDGYTETFTIGRNLSSYLNEEPYITNKSTVTLNFSYLKIDSEELIDHTHNFVSSFLLPIGTKLTLIDHIVEKIYTYEINETDNNYINGCEDVCFYPLTLFKEVGKDSDNFYSEMTYYEDGTTEENFTMVLNLKETNISTNYENVSLYFVLKDTNNIVRPTLSNTITSFNIYSDLSGQSPNAELYLNTNYSGTIEFNSDSTTSININSGLTYKYINDFKIIDTTYENKEIGLSIKLVDSEGNIIEKELLKSMLFKIGDIVYYPEKDGIIRIKLNSGIESTSKTLKITTFNNNGILKAGAYYFKISNYISYDGYYFDELGEEISIPLNVTDNIFNIPYSFGIVMDDDYRVINKETQIVKVPFNILQSGELEKPNIRVSLYKKDQVTAYNQNYTIVDLSAYVEDALNVYEGNVYYASQNPVQYIAPEYLYNEFELNLITANFENTGYKFVFELYDDIKKIGTIEKYFIIKGEQYEE